MSPEGYAVCITPELGRIFLNPFKGKSLIQEAKILLIIFEALGIGEAEDVETIAGDKLVKILECGLKHPLNSYDNVLLCSLHPSAWDLIFDVAATSLESTTMDPSNDRQEVFGFLFLPRSPNVDEQAILIERIWRSNSFGYIVEPNARPVSFELRATPTKPRRIYPVSSSAQTSRFLSDKERRTDTVTAPT